MGSRKTEQITPEQAKELRAKLKTLVREFTEGRLQQLGIEDWEIEKLTGDAVLEIDAIVSALLRKVNNRRNAALDRRQIAITTNRALRRACEHLGVDPPTRRKKLDLEAAKSKYKKLAAQYHPDRNHSDGAASQFKAICESWDVISNYAEQEKEEPHG